MTKLMKVRSRIKPIADALGWYEVTSSHYDGTPFTVKVKANCVQLNEQPTEEHDTVDGFLYVEQVGQQEDKCSIVLPVASILYGKNVTVSDKNLLPQHVTLNHFGVETANN